MTDNKKNISDCENRCVKPSEVDLKRAGIITDTFVEKVENAASVRIGSSAEEKKSAVVIRDFYNKILGLPARQEPFTVMPLAGRFGMPIYGVIYAVALAFYIIGILVDEKNVSYAFLALALVVSAAAATMITVQVLLNRNTFNALFPKRTSYNVLSSIETKGNPECTLIIGGHYDSDMDRAALLMFLKDKNLPSWLSGLLKSLSLASLPVLFVLAIVAMCLPGRNAGTKAFLFLFPTIFCGLAIFYLVTAFSYKKKKKESVGREGLQAAGITLAVADYLRLHPDLVPDNFRIVLACFGAKECGAKGSEQLILQHYGRDSFLINPVFVNFAKLGENGNTVIQGDRKYKNMYDLKLNNVAFNALKDAGTDPSFAYSKDLFTDSTPFAKHKIPTVTVELKKGDNEFSGVYNEAFEGALNVTLNTVDYMKKRQDRYKGAEKEIM